MRYQHCFEDAVGQLKAEQRITPPPSGEARGK